MVVTGFASKSEETMGHAVIVDGLRTPIGRHRGSLSAVRPDDLAADLIRTLLSRHEPAKAAIEEVIFGNTNQAARTTATSRAWCRCWRGSPTRSRASP
jgi:acetyl-CoA C-acetyltransferase